MKMTIGRKLGAGFAFLLAMFIVVGIVVYTLNARIIKDALEISQDDVPSVILSIFLLDKLEDMDVNVLKYLTGKAEELAYFEANRRAFLTSFEELAQIEKKPEEVKMMHQIERLFSDYANTTDKQIFNRYDPMVEQWAKKQADSVVHQYGAALKKRLKESAKAALKERRLTTTPKETAAEVEVLLVLMDKAGELEINLTEYVAEITKEKQDFASNAAEFETFFNKLKALKTAEIATLTEIFSLYTQLKNGAEEIFRRYNPETKEEALATLYRLEQEYFGQLEQILDSLAVEKKQDALTATSDITLIVTEITYTMMAVILLAIIVGLVVSIFLARSLTNPLALIVRGSNLLVAGDVALTDIDKREIDKITRRQDELGDIGRAFDAQANYFKAVIEDIVQVSIELAKGNLRVTPQTEYRGDFAQIKKALETSLSNQRQVIEDIVRVSQGLAEGNLRVMPKAEYQGDFAQIKQAMEVALPALQEVIKDIVRVSQSLATGNLSVMPQVEYQGDIAQIKNALDKALPHQQQVIDDIIQVSQGLAEGNLHVAPKTEYRGDFVQIKNALETALSALRQVIEDIVHVSQGLAEGNLDITPQAEYQGDFIQIKHALVTAALKLADATAKNAQQDWLKTGQTQLNDQIRGDQNIVALANKIISFLTSYVEAQIGLFYLLNESKQQDKPSLQMIASYAYIASDNRPHKILLGEGLVGQAALEHKTISITQTPEECTYIARSGLANALPRHILIIPFLYENTVKGVIEIGSAEPLADIQQEFIEQVAIPNIGIAVNTAESRTKMQTLLQKTQAQAEELQSQQEELQQSNEELQSQSEELQTQQEELQQINDELQNQREELQHKQEQLQQQNEELQSQSEELQTQQEELTQTNEALQERTNELERQKADIQQKNIALEKTQAEMEKIQVEMEKNQAALVIKAHELELASQYKSEFLANMSHELRTPLNSLLILAHLLAENKPGNLNNKQVEYARTIQSAGSDLLKLINEILDLSKVEAGKMDVHTEDVSLTDLVQAVEQKFRPLATEKCLAFHITLADDVPPVLQTDAQRLQQIINNLLSNAFKFTEQGQIKLDINKSYQGDISFTVTDTGIGIPEDKQQLIFEAFQQVDGTTSRRFGGTGLGLSISRQLAQLLGGELQLHSEEGKGSTFILFLPENRKLGQNAFGNSDMAAESRLETQEIWPSEIQAQKPYGPQKTDISVPPQTPHAQTALSSDETVTPAPKEAITDDRALIKPEDKSLLIIEDDRKFSGLLIELAREKDFKCLIAEDGKTGLQLAEQYQPDAIILDVGLPQLDGWTVMGKLKDNPETRHLPVHFISAADQSQNAKKMGAIGYLLKPVSLEELGKAFNSIEQFLAQTVKNLLLVVDNQPRQQKIMELVGSEDIETTLAVTTADALQHLKVTLFDCVILDMDIEQKSGLKLLEQMQKIEGLCQTPVIVYAERELTSAEEGLLLQCADYLTVKTARSPERLLDEATLFLHQIEANLPQDKRKMLRMVHDKEAILTNKQVLIVDDDIRNTFALTTFLEDKNMEVIVGNNGKEALELLDEHPNIAIVLMDIMMPEMDGYEAMQQIRAQERFRRLPIIALTAKAMKGDKSKCLEAGANDYLSKPVDTDKLISLMRVWLYR
jgi:signal transduction histidine kinase/CheY-like chemotaxis protein/methyl-accepting chemotaxis protein/putative methionine-R-sulfoxide reductase with GAF domain/CHASE3 domain sensor protein